MTAELNDQAPPESPAMETPQAELWNNDVKETGRWGTRSRKEVYLVVALVILMIGATAAGVAIAVVNSNKSSSGSGELVGKTKIDPVTGKLVSAYEFPVPPAPTIISDQEELDLILAELSSNSALSEKVSSIPKTVAEVAAAASSSSDPFLQAASWLTGTDTVNAKEFSVTRFALAVAYYTDAGNNWKNSTNWLSSSYHCDWFGVGCCDHILGSTLCQVDSFGRVIELDLFRNNLVGPVPESIALFPYLQTLYFSENSLTGTLPTDALVSLKNFSKLYLSYNYLTGNIPSELGSNGYLNTLYLHGNDLTGTFPENLCPCGGCKDGLLFFGVDCEKVSCGVDCCERANNCFYLNKTQSIEIQNM